MPKRRSNDFLHVEPSPKIPATGSKPELRSALLDEIGEFEDAWEDELESDEEVSQSNDEEDENGMDVDQDLPAIDESEEVPQVSQVFIPGIHTLGKDEILEPDDSVYIMRHSMDVNWPCLSFDVLRDNLGDERQRYPATAYIVAGTQADNSNKNELIVYKMSSLYRTQKDGNNSDSDDDDDDDENLDEDPIIEYRSISHPGGVNRVRNQPMQTYPQASQPYHVATWSETGKVHIWDIRSSLESLDIPGWSLDRTHPIMPVFTINSHASEGFAMDWAASGSSSLRLLTGDIHSKIYLTTSTPAGFKPLTQPFTSHTSSIEDIQWSPTEPTVFASCSADRSIQIWDVRTKGRKSVASILTAHDGDVNVISWNKLTTYLVVSGGDEGAIKTWDLRSVEKAGSNTQDPTPVASFTWHKAPITSIEWHPTEDSIFAASGADDQVTLWDLAVEEDEDEMGTGEPFIGGQSLPSQLLFVHQGQKDVKEIHWHPQIPGSVISTAWSGFNIFKTISV